MPTTTIPTNCNQLTCSNSGTCEVTNGIASCKCKSGFTGYYCEQTDPCIPKLILLKSKDYRY